MDLKHAPELAKFLSTVIFDSDLETEEQAIQNFIANASSELVQKIKAQLQAVIELTELSVEELGSTANRWFGEEHEAQAWFQSVAAHFERSGAATGAGTSSAEVVVKDSNGAILSEGDSVTVIKDLKVRGGSSDLKRGTMIRKIHLVGDPEVIECRVDGSTLVLKTCYLKKA